MSEKTHIAKIVNGGYGFARLASGQVALIRQALPDETVIITIEETKKNHLFGSVRQILRAHPARRDPPCKYYGQCGGCDLQHCDYDTQLIIKQGIIEDLLRRQKTTAVQEAVALLAAPLPSPAVFGYRQRIRLQVGPRGAVGFYRFRSHDIIAIESCLLAGDAINTTLAALRKENSGRRLSEIASEIELQLNPATGRIVPIFHLLRKVRPADAESARQFCRDNSMVERIFFVGADFPLTGPYGLSEHLEQGQMDFAVHYSLLAGVDHPVRLSWEAGGFCQVNLAQNIHLIEIVKQFCRLDQTETVLDLYFGMGNFSIFLAMQAKEVLGVEAQGAAIRSAKKNAALAGLTNTHFIKQSVDDFCRDLAAKNQQFDCVVLDPPRQGAPGLARQLAAITAQRLVYISCDPATLCRDLVDLCDASFSVRMVQPLDMFPQTHHIETVVLLEKGCKPRKDRLKS